MVARLSDTQEIIGSNPIPATQCESICAQLAQLVEQRTENPRVSGSIPELGIVFCLKIIWDTSSVGRAPDF